MEWGSVSAREKEQEIMKLRIKFAKYGVVKFIGHLDIMRYFQKAIRRAGIDVAYTGGYSPHQIMSFAAPLGVGLESYGEYFDLEVNSFEGTEQFITTLNNTMVPGIEILQVTELPEQAGNAMASVAAAKYEVCFKEGYEPEFDWVSQFETFRNLPEMIVTKKTKKSETQLNLKPYLFELSITKEGVITMTVDASSAGNIKPSLVMKAFLESTGHELNELSLSVTRLETYRKKEAASEAGFLPMNAGY